jgi:hypothetical protein
MKSAQRQQQRSSSTAPAQRERSERAVLKVKSNINSNIFLFTT